MGGGNVFDFIKKKFSGTTDIVVREEAGEDENGATDIGASYAATTAAQEATRRAAAKFAKPDTYTGNRTLYDSSKAKVTRKQNFFRQENLLLIHIQEIHWF